MLSVEDPVWAILEQLKTEEVGSIYQMGDGIVFEKHPHAISDVAEEVVARETPASPPRTPSHRRDLHQLRPDRICVYRDSSVSAQRTMVYVCEYKPPHKLAAPHLRVGIRAMNIYKDAVNRKNEVKLDTADYRLWRASQSSHFDPYDFTTGASAFMLANADLDKAIPALITICLAGYFHHKPTLRELLILGRARRRKTAENFRHLYAKQDGNQIKIRARVRARTMKNGFATQTI
ncbi:hypothetical protein PG991_009195 [Apiospora marii]|uniref:Uncharacterized protein n=1 Tax=Apiospora marii TaxID=335849 RepID=A0ABR1RJY6_9PEZI